VIVTINGFTIRRRVALMGGVFMVPVIAEILAGAGVVAAQDVEVDVQLDTAPRSVDVPANFAAALDANGAARTAFDRLFYNNQ